MKNMQQNEWGDGESTLLLVIDVVKIASNKNSAKNERTHRWRSNRINQIYESQEQ